MSTYRIGTRQALVLVKPFLSCLRQIVNFGGTHESGQPGQR